MNRTPPIASDPRFSDLYPGHPNSKHPDNITQMDHALGKVMDALDAKDLAAKTLFFFTSDNDL